MSINSEDEKIDYLYKYSSFGNKNCEGKDCLLDSLKNNYIRFSDPTDFNDPFDGYVDFYLKGSKEEFYDWFKATETPEDQWEILYNKFKDDPESFTVKEMPKNLARICCFSKSCDKIPMWSHYSNSFKGICLKFKTNNQFNLLGINFEKESLKKEVFNQSKGFLPVHKLSYQENMPERHNLLDKNDSTLRQFYLRKHTLWSYEEERRIILTPDFSESQNVKFEKSSLHGIIFGLRTSYENKDAVVDIIRQNYDFDNFHFYESVRVPHKYAIKVVEITDIDKYLAILKPDESPL